MDFSTSSILITGGAGFIGSHIAEFLLKNGAKFVRILDNLSTGSIKNIDHLMSYPNLEFVRGDITSIETCRRACENITSICHQAALGSVPRSIHDPLSSHNTNVDGFLNILVASKEKGIKRIVFASSSSVYGNNSDGVKTEENIGQQLSPYAITKYIDELYGRIFTNIYGLECIGLRYFNIFGPRQNPCGPYAAVIPKFIKSILQNERPIINGDGTYSRDFTYVDNAVYANCLALATTNAKCFGEIFNVGTNHNISIKQLFKSITRILGKDLEPIYEEPRLGDIPYSNASISKIGIYLSYSPKVYFSEGLEKTIEHYRIGG